MTQNGDQISRAGLQENDRLSNSFEALVNLIYLARTTEDLGDVRRFLDRAELELDLIGAFIRKARADTAPRNQQQ